MKESRKTGGNKVRLSLIALSFCLQIPMAAQADKVSQVQSEVPAIDEGGSASAISPAPPVSAPEQKVLQDVQLQAAVPTLDESQRFELSVTKLRSGAEMTKDDFRDLGIGTLGMVANQSGWDRYPRVTRVFEGSPAQTAGIKVGDLVLANDSIPNEKPGSWDSERWQFRFDHVGTQANVTVKRGRETLNFTLTRMNIEDLPDPQVRRIYEEQAKKLGSSGAGTIDNYRRPRELGHGIPKG